MFKLFPLFFLFFCFTSCNSPAQEPQKHDQEPSPLNIVVSNRVQMEQDANKAEILALYKKYLLSNPESIEKNPYWNTQEQEKYEQFNLSLPYLFQGFGAKMLSRYMDLYVMSIEPSGKERYTLRVQYQMKGGLQNGSSIWCIHQVDAIKENGKWVLQNFLVQKTEKWKQESIGNINYRFAPSYQFQTEKAQAAARFVDSLKTLFKLESSSTPIDYYLVKNADELGELIGFDYFFVGYTAGITKAEMASIYTSKGEYHAHELVHLVLHQEKVKRHFLIEEGIAEFLGSKLQNLDKYHKEREMLIHDLKNKEGFTISSILEGKMAYDGYNYKYAFGAAICELVYQEKGIEGLKKIINSNSSSNNELLNLIYSILEIETPVQLVNLLSE